MVPIEQETNIEILRTYTKLLQGKVLTLAKENQLLKNASDAERQEWINQELIDQYTKLKIKFFSSGRETISSRVQGHEEAQLNLHSEYKSEKLKPPPAKENLPQGPTYVYKMSDRELTNESAGRGITVGANAWEIIEGLYQTSKMINVIERTYQEETHAQCKYRLKKEFNSFGKDVIITAPGPVKLRSGSRYSLDFALQVVVDKYEYHLPLERQRRQMEALGLNVDVKTLYGLCEAVSEHCATIIPKIKKEIFSDFCAVHIDESPWKILGSRTSAYMWIVSNRIGSIYNFEPSRSGDVAVEILDGYKGSIVSDGFSGYKKIKSQHGIRAQHCWSHARREFFEIHTSYPEDTKAIIDLIDEIFILEKDAKNFDELKEIRRTKSRKVISDLYNLIVQTKLNCMQSFGLRKACDYVLNHWVELTQFLSDLSVPLTNNDAERALRHIVMGRKNFNGSKTINGADVAANIYSVIESAKKAGLQPKEYLKYLIEERWYTSNAKTPQEYAAQNRKPNPIIFPVKSQWHI